MPINIGQIDVNIDPRDPTGAMRATIARLEQRIAQLERALTVEADGSVTVQSSGRLRISSMRGVELSTPAASLKIEVTGIRASAPTITWSSSNINLDAALTTSTGIVGCDVLRCTTVIAATYTPGAGNVW